MSEPFDTVARMTRVDQSIAKQLSGAMTENARLKAENDRLRKALSFYADPERHLGPNQHLKDGTDPWNPDCPYVWDVTRDNGRIAREALKVTP